MARYGFPPHYVTLVLFGIVSIIPSVLILSYFHGSPGKYEWTRIEKIGVPINIIFIGIIILLGNNYNWWLGEIKMIEIEESKLIVIAEITSNDKILNC